MKIKKIEIKDFRNIEYLDAAFDDVNIIWGENAQGKTNLIEALYLFTGAKSFRGVKDKELVKFGSELSKLSIEFESSGREQTAQLVIKGRREATLNQIKKKSAASLGDEIKAVIFSPVHLSMIKDGPAERRKFIDSALCQIKSGYKNLLKDYNRSLAQRNNLLKDIYQNPELDSMLYIWNTNLAKTGAKIVYQRLRYIEAITPFVKDIYSGISSGTEEIDINYIGSANKICDVSEIEKNILLQLEENKVQDLQNKTTSVGAHRDDIDVLINGNSARKYASQGQQRSCVLALKLAEAALLEQMTGEKPIALLDDVMSELDEKRQDYILNRIDGLQVFITCCDKEQILRLKDGKTIQINNGKIEL
ncbi:MAG: DNA replication/repair protein RecF [Ruminococcaceae bacterium]|nr:DNA replication/repair protein RecF [Oscillospiraceae bacterium]